MGRPISFLFSLLVVVGGGCGGDDPSEAGGADESIEAAATPGPVFNPRCEAVMGVDGAGGFLWKPVSDYYDELVVILPARFTVPFLRLDVFQVKTILHGKVVALDPPRTESCTFNGFANGGRQHWRCDLPGRFYDGHVVAVDEAQVCEWQVAHPGKRQD